MTNEYYEANKKNWESRTECHISKSTEYYNFEDFYNGKSTLLPIEIEALGDVADKALLHLQCHIGFDTLSWARKGAIVTGVDISEKSIKFARNLARKVNISSASFIESDLFELKTTQLLPNSFDIVFTSYGVLCWIDDLNEWAEIISYFLKDGGTFLVIDGHPFLDILEENENNKLEIIYDYFKRSKPYKFDDGETYADLNAKLENKINYQWNHSISEITNALINAGLKIEFLKEYDFGFFQRYSFLQRKENGLYYQKGDSNLNKIPYILSIKAKK